MAITRALRFLRRQANFTELSLDAPEFFQDPYPIYKKLRRDQPVVAVRPNGYLITRHSDILQALSSEKLRNAPSRYSVLQAGNADKYVAADLVKNILPFLDNPQHQAPRTSVIRAVHSRLKQLDGCFEPIAQQAMSHYLAGDNRDLISGFTAPYALHLMCHFMGIDLQQSVRFKEYSHAFFYLFAPITDSAHFQTLNQKIQLFRDEMAQLVEARRTAPQEDFISALLQGDGDDEQERLSTAEIIDNCILVFADGIENIEAAIANVLAAYFDDRAAQQMYRTSELDISNLVSEGLRLQTPAQFIARIASEELQIGGFDIAPETPVFLALASANRDPQCFEKSESFLPERNPRDLLTFGRGQHSCIGGRLASLQIGAAVKAVLEADLKPEKKLTQLSYKARLAHRWPESYPMHR